MKTFKTSLALGRPLLFLVSCALLGCHEPNQATADNKVGKTAQASTSRKVALESLVAYKPESQVAELKTCNLESAKGLPFQGRKIAVPRGESIRFSGWIVAMDMASPSYFLRLENKVSALYYQVRLAPAAERPDVAAKLGESAEKSGFAINLNLGNLPPGDYHAFLAASSGGALDICDNGRTVTVVR